jgi:hypothetical protein
VAKLSLTSKALHLLGSFFIGTPESLHMPADFYFEKGDRQLPTVQEMQQFVTQRNRLTVDAVRRGLLVRMGILTSVASVSVALAILLILNPFFHH